jgi:hypothetical protein
MVTNTYNPTVIQNNDWSFNISTSPIVNLTGSTIALQIRDWQGNIIKTLNIGSGITVPTPTNGVAYFILTAAQTLLIPVGTYPFGITVTDSGGGKQPLATGVLTISAVRVS